jgi:hypothetical protein
VWRRLRLADEQPFARQVVHPGQGQVVDVDRQPRPQHVLAHRVHLGGPARQERAVLRASTIAIAVSASAARA